MHAVYRSRFQHDKNRIQILMFLHTFSNHIYKLIGTRLKGETAVPSDIRLYLISYHRIYLY